MTEMMDDLYKDYDPDEIKRFLSSCAGASVGLGLAFIGLAASGATVVGAGIGAAGFIYASVQWGAACR